MIPASKHLTAGELYVEKQTAVGLLLMQLQAQLADHAVRQSRQPRDYGYVGDLAHVEERLRELRGFLMPTGGNNDQLN